MQPQWVFDCLNAGKLVPHEAYAPGVQPLPPHRSPFVRDDEDVQASEDEEPIAVDADADTPAQDADTPAPTVIVSKKQERRQLAASLLSKKQRKVYERVASSKERLRKIASKPTVRPAL